MSRASVTTFGHRGTTSSIRTEISRELVNASDGAGLHFDGAAGSIDIASPPDLGTKFSFEFIIQAHEWGSTYSTIVDFGDGGTFILGSWVANSYNLGIQDGGDRSFGVKVLDDLKVHHLVVTVDGTSAVLYDNGNQVGIATLGTQTIDSATDAVIGSNYTASAGFFNGTIYRARFYNKALEPDEVQTAYERADVDFVDQYGSETDLVNANSSGSGTAWTGASGGTAPNGWSPAGTSKTYTIDSGTGNPAPSLKITSTGSPNVGIKWGGTTVLGRRYQATFSYKCGDASTTLSYRLNDADSFVNLDNSTSWATKTVEWIGDGVTSAFMLRVNESGKFGHFDTVSIKSIGCVSDYDLAFANPKNSFKINDRSGAADGTASNDGTNPTGISQVQVIKQLNATAARIGTTAATPADGQILTSGDIGVGGSPSTTASTSTIEAVNSGTARVLMKSTGTGGREYGLWTSTSGNLGFFDYTAGANRISISSTGLATFSGGINLGNQTMSSYQTGDWYPLLYYQNGTDVTIGGTAYASQGVSDYTSQYGHYVRVGKLVHVEGYLKVNVQNTGSFAADNIGISGLPFAHRNLTDANCLLTVNSTGGGGTISGGVLSANSTIAVMQTISGTGNLGATVGANSALRVWINGTYFTEA